MTKINTTETVPKKKFYIDLLPNIEALNIMLKNQLEGFEAVKKAINSISICVDKVERLLSKNKKNKLIYVGAGTSARIAVQDGVELYPTFGWPRHRVKFIIAGGKKALTRSVEGAEDLRDKKIDEVVKDFIQPNDVVIGLAASGTTKFTVEIIKYANKIGALTIGITNNVNTKLEKYSQIPIILNTGTEIVAGSTRLKAGTSQKICLNLISTLVMARLGRVKNGLMNNMVVSNKKLLLRKKKIDFLLSQNKRD